MIGTTRRLAVAGVLGGLLICGTGCFWLLAGAAAGAGTVVYIDGKLVKKYDAPMDKAWVAATGAIKGLGFRVEAEQHDAAFGRIEARRADDKPVKVELKRLSDAQTEIAVRVGMIGGRDDELQVLDAIDKRIGQ